MFRTFVGPAAARALAKTTSSNPQDTGISSSSLPNAVIPIAFPAIIFHHEAVHGLDRFFLEHEALALVPAPGLLVLADATQPDFVWQLRAGEGEQLTADRA